MNSSLRTLGCLLLLTTCAATAVSQVVEKGKTASPDKSHLSLKATYSAAKGIGAEKGVMRRDPSDIIKVGSLYYVWYSKGRISPGYDATVWYATSPDGHTWTEKSMALAKGKPGGWDGASVFTPNILVAGERYWLFYTGTSKEYKKPFNPDSKIGVAVSYSPDGPWERVGDNPIIANSEGPDTFDSHLIDDACLIVRGGKYWCYFKGRQLGKGPGQTKMGLAIADKPEGPYVKYENNPVIPGNHEVLIWPQGNGVAALIGTTGPKEITRSVLYSKDGFDFAKTHDVMAVPRAAGAFRPEAFTDSGEGNQIKWGVHIGTKNGFLPFIERFDFSQDTQAALTDSTTTEQFGRQESATGIKHSFLIAGPITALVGGDGQVKWRTKGRSRDAFVLENGNVLATIANTAKEITREGKVAWSYKLAPENKELGTAVRLANGNTLVVERGVKPRLLEVTKDGKIAVEVPLQPETDNAHMQTRMARKLSNGNYLVPHLLAFKVNEYQPDGNIVRTIATDLKELGGREAENWPFTAIRLKNGNTLVNLTHGNKTVEFDTEGKVAWKVTNEDVAGRFADPCGGQRLANGNTVICSYAQKDAEKPKLFEVTPDKKVVWEFFHPKARAHEVHILTTNGKKEGYMK